MEYNPAYGNLNSSQSKHLISILKQELSILCKRANPQNFKDVHIVRLMRGSVIAESVAEYNYPNNNSQIMMLNTNLGPALEQIFEDPNSLKNLSVALGNVPIESSNITMENATVLDISELKPFVNCPENFANLTEEIENGVWVCVGSCKKNVNFCNQHGKCLNEITGPQCKCYSSYFEKYEGAHCELYSRGAGFYAVLFGSLAAFALLMIVSAVMVVVLYRAKRTRKLSFFDDVAFDFSSRGPIDRGYWHQNFSATEDSEPGSYGEHNYHSSA
ncbi:hypothetical protein F2P79_011787 [Pimephales promelas]|nr:hypothetical protein F2P79_011787 [Pimephales promelas]KAG1950228.1 hypothetical protein F2P79_011787 [Pimephales promelas]